MTEPIHVLIIDDDPGIRFLTKHFLMNYNSPVLFSVREATNGEEALLDISTASRLPDFVLLDINMPVMNGYEFLEAYSELSLPADTEPHIYVLSTVTDELPPTAQEIVKGHFQKPITEQHIKIILSSMGLHDA